MSKKLKFIKEDKNPLFNPVDWFNFFGSFVSIFEGIKDCNIKSESEVCFLDPSSMDVKDMNVPTFKLSGHCVEVVKNNKFDLAKGSVISKFMLLSAIKFKGDSMAAMSYVAFYLMKSEIPYIRVGTDYYKIIKKDSRWGATNIILKPWKKDEIKEDHTKAIFPLIFKYDDFTIIPSNKTFIPVKNNCYNLYSQFPHQSAEKKEVSTSEIPVTLGLLKHIFGEQIDLGLKYMKILYEYPQQILPILSLVSTERETGKTTFLNWINMIFGENSVLISPTDLTQNFNSIYATKNIIMVDETVIEKSMTVEKLKSLGTAKTISVSQKFVSSYQVPFFGKIILCTNKEKDFMKIDEDEIRFWVRKINPIKGKKNTKIENDLFNEIPDFLRFLELLPEVDFSKSRMVFTQEEISTGQLKVIKEESKSQLRKEIEANVEHFFMQKASGKEEIQHLLKEFKATAKDIKERWFSNNNQVTISYIRKVLRDEMKLEVSKICRYTPFDEISLNEAVGQPFLFKNEFYKEIDVFEQSTDIKEYNGDVPF